MTASKDFKAAAAEWNDAVFCERAVVGRMLLYPETIPDASFLLVEDDFSHPVRRRAFAALVANKSLSQATELSAIAQMIHDATSGDHTKTLIELVECELHVSSQMNMHYYANGVAQHARLRKLKAEASAAAKTEATSVDEVTAMLERAVANAEMPDDERPEELAAALARKVNELDHETTTGDRKRYTVDLIAFDRILGGLRAGEFIAIGARPGGGKTALGLQLAEAVAMTSQAPALFFSIEMTKSELAARTLARMTNVSHTRIRDVVIHDDDWAPLQGVVRAYEKVPLYVVDDPRITIGKIRALAERASMRKQLGLIVVDYLQLVRTGMRFDTREQEVSFVSHELKAIARTLRVCVIALAQLNRDTDKKARRPQLSDFRESGAVEQDADSAILIHRPCLTDAEADLEFAELVVAKNRHGEIGLTPMRFNLRHSHFEDGVRP